jgi:hypothetical protein
MPRIMLEAQSGKEFPNAIHRVWGPNSLPALRRQALGDPWTGPTPVARGRSEENHSRIWDIVNKCGRVFLRVCHPQGLRL